MNYAEFGFENKTTAKPNLQWHLLCALAQANGTLRNQAAKGPNWIAFEQKIHRLKKTLKEYYPQTKGDPLSCQEGIYRAHFKIKRAPSF